MSSARFMELTASITRSRLTMLTLQFKQPQPRFLRINQRMPFGKHKGEKIDDLLWEDPRYLAYLQRENAIKLGKEVQKELEYQLELQFEYTEECSFPWDLFDD